MHYLALRHLYQNLITKKSTLMKIFIATLFISLSIISCQKASNDTLDPTPVPPVTKPDSLWILDHVTAASNGDGDSFFFEYDSTHQITKFYMPYAWAKNSPCYIFYKNNRVSHIVSDFKDPNYGVLKASLILTYGTNNKVTRVNYKLPLSGLTNTSPYLSDLLDGKVYYEYDSLTYSASNQLQQLYHFGPVGLEIKPVSLVKFYYPATTDSVFNKLEYYNFDVNSNPVLYDQLAITTNSYDNIFYPNLKYYCFVRNLTILSGLGTTNLPYLFDQPSTVLNKYLSFSPKTIATYKVTNNWGSYNNSTTLDYSYNADSTIFTGSKQSIATTVTNYYRIKIKR